MSFLDALAKRRTSMDAALWLGSGAVVLAVHLGAVAWVLRAQPTSAADDSPPAAIMMELAATPEAINTDMNEIAPDQHTAAASAASAASDAEKDVPEEQVAEQEPPTDEPAKEQAVIPPDPVAPPMAVSTTEPPAPSPKPEPKKKRKPEPQKPQKKRQASQAPSQAAMEARAQAPQGARNAAAATASGVSAMSPATWQSRLMAHLERRKRYPHGARSRGERGVVYVQFRIDDGGNVLSVSLFRSSGYGELDNEVLSLLRRASPLPAPPPGVKKTITAPVRFSTI